jgi:hypothetical protein
MQTQGRTLQPPGEHSYKRTVEGGRFVENKRSKANETANGRPAHDFMNTVFHPIPATRLPPLFNGNNYDFLYHSARNYWNFWIVPLI